MTEKTLTLLMMDAPYEQARTATAFRLMDAALRLGFGIRVFAYEGAVALSSSQQRPHPNSLHGRTVEEEKHPTPHEWIAALGRLAADRKLVFEWVNCGLCVDERGITTFVDGVRRGAPADFWRMSRESENTLIIPTR